MKSEALKNYLDTGYSVSEGEDNIEIGSAYVHDIIKLNKKTLKLSYALDTFREGRASIKNEQLENVWDKLEELVKSGDIKEFIEGDNEFENPLPVFHHENLEIIETSCSAYGHPNTTKEGMLMYNNTHFKTREAAVKDATEEGEYWLKSINERIPEKEAELLKLKSEKANIILNLKKLKDGE